VDSCSRFDVSMTSAGLAGGWLVSTELCMVGDVSLYKRPRRWWKTSVLNIAAMKFKRVVFKASVVRFEGLERKWVQIGGNCSRRASAREPTLQREGTLLKSCASEIIISSTRSVQIYQYLLTTINVQDPASRCDLAPSLLNHPQLTLLIPISRLMLDARNL